MKRLVFVLLMVLACGNPPTPPEPVEGPPAAPTPADPLAYDALCAKGRELTAAQWDAHFPTLKGRLVQWEGAVSEVDQFAGQYFAWLDLGEPYSKTDVKIDLPQDVAMALQKGQVVRVTGQLDTFGPNTCTAELRAGSVIQ